MLRQELSPIKKKWLLVCQNIETKLHSGEYRTVVHAADMEGVNQRMLSRYAKGFGINLNLKGHGVKKPVDAPIEPHEEPVPIKLESNLWSAALFNKAA